MRGSRAAVVLLVILGSACTAAAPAAADAVLRGVCEPGLLETWDRGGPAIVNEFSDKLAADVMRINLRWSEAEPAQGVYDGDYLGRAMKATAIAHDKGMSVVVVVYETPRWASDRTLWGTAAPGDTAARYHSYYPPSLVQLDGFRAFMQHLSAKFSGNVLGYSCWVEPNLWTYFYPQRRAGDPAFAAHRYERMLAAFAQGVHAGDPSAQVIAGETAPFGDNTRLSTSPQRFARQLQACGAAQYFDVYAHHPYAVGGTKRVSPAAMPRDPDHTVVLANLETLTSIFPDKPFYLSEYGYATSDNLLFGVSVDEVTQASYLRRAFEYVTRYPQVKLLLWFPLWDWSATHTYRYRFGVYTGLRALSGRRKRAYYAFAGGNAVSLSAPEAIRRGEALTLRGALTSATMGALTGKWLVIEGRKAGGRWVQVSRCRTGDEGKYVTRVRPLVGAFWRVRWRGVAGSSAAWVAVR